MPTTSRRNKRTGATSTPPAVHIRPLPGIHPTTPTTGVSSSTRASPPMPAPPLPSLRARKTEPWPWKSEVSSFQPFFFSFFQLFLHFSSSSRQYSQSFVRNSRFHGVAHLAWTVSFEIFVEFDELSSSFLPSAFAFCLRLARRVTVKFPPAIRYGEPETISFQLNFRKISLWNSSIFHS